tara:strand:+ start:330 stop:1643 length:1314 start_codon:yes stop_codon:yes gene_type:complete
MQIIQNNPFRVLGIISNSSAKETKESETFILRYLDIGKSADLKFDITPPLSHLERTSEIVKNAKRKIHDDFDKLAHSIFWFVNGTMVDKIALDKLSSEKNIEKALESFKKGSRDFAISKKSFSSILNFSTLEIVSYTSHKDEERLKNAIKYKYQIIKDKIVFKEFEKLITSTSDKINHKSYIDRYIENTKGLLKELFPRKDQNKLLLDIFSEDENILKEIEGQIVSSLVEEINENLGLFNSFFEAQSRKTDAQIVRSRSSIINRAKKLVADTKSDLNKLKKAVGKNDFQFSNLINEVYLNVFASVIMCFNKDMDALNARIQVNNVSQYGGDVTYPSFKLYIDIFEESSKALSSINCSIKNRLNENLQSIKKINREAQKRQREQSSNTYSGGSSYGGSSYGGSSYGGSTYSGGSSTDSDFGGYLIAFIIFCCFIGMCS